MYRAFIDLPPPSSSLWLHLRLFCTIPDQKNDERVLFWFLDSTSILTFSKALQGKSAAHGSFDGKRKTRKPQKQSIEKRYLTCKEKMEDEVNSENFML